MLPTKTQPKAVKRSSLNIASLALDAASIATSLFPIVPGVQFAINTVRKELIHKGLMPGMVSRKYLINTGVRSYMADMRPYPGRSFIIGNRLAKQEIPPVQLAIARERIAALNTGWKNRVRYTIKPSVPVEHLKPPVLNPIQFSGWNSKRFETNAQKPEQPSLGSKGVREQPVKMRPRR